MVKTAQADTIQGNLDRLAELVSTLARQDHPLTLEFHAAYVDLREGVENLKAGA